MSHDGFITTKRRNETKFFYTTMNFGIPFFFPSSMTDNGQTKKRGRKQAAFTRAPPIILDRRERIESKPTSTEDKEEEAKDTVIPFMRRPAKFNTDAILKVNLRSKDNILN